MTKVIDSKYRIDEAVRLREVRRNTGLTQEEFAARVNMSLSAYKKAERGDNRISVNLLKALYKEFQISADYILYGEKGDFESTWMEIQNCTKKDKLCFLIRLVNYFSDNQATEGYMWSSRELSDEEIYTLVGELVTKSTL
jgi:transcriptional regulator with XRE-family HTH domain